MGDRYSAFLRRVVLQAARIRMGRTRLSIIWIALWIMAICTIGEFTAFTLYPYYVR